MINSTDVIANAESAFLNGKRGTFAIVRTPEDGKLWYAAPGVQSDVLLLRMYANGRAIVYGRASNHFNDMGRATCRY